MRGFGMTTVEYLAALRQLGLPPYAQRTAEALGKSSATLASYARGLRRIPPVVERLLHVMLAEQRRRFPRAK